MREFEQNVVLYCRRQRLFPRGGAVLTALSGGGDSVGLLYTLVRIADILGITVEAAHLNHALRGVESDGDEEFSRSICDRLGVRLTVKRLSEGELNIRGESLETAAREARREFLLSIAYERQIPWIATGHTRNDLAETVLHRLLRGTGPSGLTGISPVADNRWVRPFLGTGRNEIRAYLEECGIGFREDASNREAVYFRNRIRHELIPYLQEHFSPAIIDGLVRLAELSGQQENYFEGITEESVRKCCIYKSLDKILLDVQSFLAYHIMLRQRIVRRCLELLEGEGRDTDRDEVENLLALLEQGRGEMDVTSRIRAGVSNGVAVFVRANNQWGPLTVRIPGCTDIPCGGKIHARETTAPEKVDGKEGVLIGTEVIQKFGGLTIGPVRRGEYMIPFGMERPVKLYDILADSAVPRVLRDSMPVVRAGAVPVWAPGVKSAECLRLSGHPLGTILLTCENGLRWRR